jgi:HPt (histidine-containing phosphotransfer) domain-containing protein
MTANAMQGDREKCLASGMDDYLSKPVRLEDIRGIMERWGATAGKVDSRESALEAPKAATPADSSGSVAAVASTEEESPVDMERLLDFTEGSLDSLKELVTLYLDQTTGQMEQLENAVQAGNASEVRRVAHSCAGASATCGMQLLVPLLRDLEKQGFEETLTTAAEVCAAAVKEFERIRLFLDDYIAKQSAVASQA